MIMINFDDLVKSQIFQNDITKYQRVMMYKEHIFRLFTTVSNLLFKNFLLIVIKFCVINAQ